MSISQLIGTVMLVTFVIALIAVVISEDWKAGVFSILITLWVVVGAFLVVEG